MKCKKGYKEKDGECVKVKKWFSSKSGKSYNPFKLWGSYVGAVIAPIITIFTIPMPFLPINITIKELFNRYSTNTGLGFIDFIKYLFDFKQEPMILITILSMLLISMVAGFLLGWLIQSLWRKFRK